MQSSDVRETSFEGSMYMRDEGGVWKHVTALYTPNKTLRIGGVQIALSNIVTARHDSLAPRKFAEYGFCITLHSGSTIHLCALTGIAKFDWIERLTPQQNAASSSSFDFTGSPVRTPEPLSPSTPVFDASQEAMLLRLIERLQKENSELRRVVEARNAELKDTKAKLKDVVQGYKEEICKTVELKRELLITQTALAEYEYAMKSKRRNSFGL